MSAADMLKFQIPPIIIISMRVVLKGGIKGPWRGSKRGFKGRSKKSVPWEGSQRRTIGTKRVGLKRECPKNGYPKGVSQAIQGGFKVESQGESQRKSQRGNTKPGHENFQFGHVKCPSDIGHDWHRTCLVPPWIPLLSY